MKLDTDMIRVGSPYFAPAVLFAAAVLTLLVAAVTNRGDMTSAVLVLVGFMLLITGVFLLTTLQRDPLPVTLTELLPVQGTVNMTMLLADLGVTSNTLYRYLPETKSAVQINPVTGGAIPDLPESVVFVTAGDWNGVQYPAVAAALLHRLKQTDHLTVPIHDPEMLATCLREVLTDTLEVAGQVTTTRTETAVTVVLEKFSLPRTCRTLHAVSIKCCTMVGCPVCSLIGSLIAESEACDVMADSVVLENDELTAVFSLHPRVAAEKVQ